MFRFHPVLYKTLLATLSVRFRRALQFYCCRPSSPIPFAVRKPRPLPAAKHLHAGDAGPPSPHHPPSRWPWPLLGVSVLADVNDARHAGRARVEVASPTLGKITMRMKRVLPNSPTSNGGAGSMESDLSRRYALTEAEAAVYLGMSRAWLKKARTVRFRGAIDAPPFVKAGARRVVYRRRDLEEWAQAHVRSRSAGAEWPHP